LTGGKGGKSSSGKSVKGRNSVKKGIETPDSKMLERLLNSDRFRNVKVSKHEMTLSKYSDSWIDSYRIQEEERYKFPKRSWIYFNEDGTLSIVGPVANNKKNGQQNQKPRDHP
jgi:hypothetical protein